MVKSRLLKCKAVAISAVTVLSSVAGAMSMPMYAYASESEPVEVHAEGNEDTAFEYDSIDVETDGDALYVEGNDESNVGVLVNGDVINEGNGTGVEVVATDQSFAGAQVEGDVSAGDTGVAACSTGDGEAFVNVEGNVEARLEEDGQPYNAIFAYATDNGYSGIVVGGDAIGQNGITAFGDKQGETGVWVTGDVSGIVNGIVAIGNSYVEVLGDVTGDNIGLTVANRGEKKPDILIAGTLSGGTIPIRLAEGAEPNSLIVWKIEPSEGGGLAYNVITNESSEVKNVERNEEFEEKIIYMIRVDQPAAGAKLSVCYEDGIPLQIIGEDDTAPVSYAGEKVLLKVDLADGYTLEAAYGDAGQSVPLVKDENGNWYVIVPNGGGVQFSVTLVALPVDDDDDEVINNPSDDTTPPTPQTPGAGTGSGVGTGSSETMTDTEVISTISDAAPGSTITIPDVTENGLSAAVVTALLARRDVTTNITYMLNGKRYIIAIAAGTDLSDLINAQGGIDLAALRKKFISIDVYDILKNLGLNIGM